MRAPIAFGTQTMGEERLIVAGVPYQKGEKLRLKLDRTESADAMLDGLIATLETIFQDDDRVYLAVTLDDDPSQEMQRELARYMFFAPDEVEKVQNAEPPVIVNRLLFNIPREP